MPEHSPMVSSDLAWDIVQHQVGGPGSTDRGCVDEGLRREIWERAIAAVADCGYRALHTGHHDGTLVLYRPAEPGEESSIEAGFAAMLLSDLNVIADVAGRRLLQRVVGELAQEALVHPWEGDWGCVAAESGGLDVVLPAG